MKHTPGPWETHEGIDYRHVYGGDFNDSESPIASVSSSKANARLIAASPDLMEVAKRTVAHLLNGCPVGGNPVSTMNVSEAALYTAAIQALAKAETE